MKRISEVLKEASKQKDRDGKIAKLKENDSEALRAVLQATFDERIIFELPPGVPPYKEPDDMVDNNAGIFTEYRKFYIWTKNRKSAQMKQMKRENVFIQTLESVHPDDAKLLIAMKDKKMPYKGITKKLVQEAFGEDFVK